MAKKNTGKKLSTGQKKNKLRSKSGFPASGCWVNIFDPVVGELVGRCGYDYAMIDMEHSPVTSEQALAMIRAVQLGGAKALVRIPVKQTHWVGRLMDMGADGVMVPMVNSASEASTLAAATVYAPAGTRGMAAGIVRAAGYGCDLEHYLENYRDEFLLLVQIETAEAVDQAANIAAVEGVDCVFIGPYDLAGSLGNMAQPDHAQTKKAIRKVTRAVKAEGKLLSTLTTPKLGTRRLLDGGYDLVFSGSDLSMLRQAMQSDSANSEQIMGQHN